MPSGMLTLQDTAPIYGMNTVDDANLLQPGECVRILNAFPGNPPKLINGSLSTLFQSSTNLRFIPPGISFSYNGTIYIVVWVQTGDASFTYQLLTFDKDTDGAVYADPAALDGWYSMGYGSFLNSGAVPFFDFIELYGNVYASMSPVMDNWQEDTKALGMKVVESNLVVRDMCISTAGSISAIGQVTPGGSFVSGNFFDYAFQYVRHTSSAYFEAGTTPTGMILPPAVTGKPKRIDTFLPGECVGVEDTANRKNVEITAPTSYVTLNLTNSHATAIAQGATHLRVSRTLAATSKVLSQGATHFFLADLPLISATYSDTTADTALSGEVNQLLTGYTSAPAGAFIEYAKGRLFIMTSSGKVYYSEAPGADGAYSLTNAEAYPQAWASLFKPLAYYIDCDSADGQKATGMKKLGDDLFFFKERKVFALYGSDPLSTAVTQVSQTTGCAFPYTLSKCELRGLFGNCLLFLSNEGPMVLLEGGRLRFFSEMKIAQLWPDKSQELFGELDTDHDWIVQNCSAKYFKNAWWVMYVTRTLVSGNYTYTNKIFGYYVDPVLVSDNKGPHGAFEFKFADIL